MVKITGDIINPIPLSFWEELHMKATSEWPSVVRKYNLTPDQIERAAERIKRDRESQASWAETSVRNFKKW